MIGLAGKKCRIHVNINDKDLFYEATLLDIDKVHVSFVDKFDTIHVFHKKYIEEISEMQ